MLRSENAYFRQQLGIGVNSWPLSSSQPAAMPTSAPSRLHSGVPRGTSPRRRGEPRSGPAGGRLAPLGAGEGGAAARRGRDSPPSSSHGQPREPPGLRGGQAGGRGSSRLGNGAGAQGGGGPGGGGRKGSPRRKPSAEDFESMAQKNQELTVAKNLLELELRDAGAENARLEAKLEHLEAVFTSSSQVGGLLLDEGPAVGRREEEGGECSQPARAPAASLASPPAGPAGNRGPAEVPEAEAEPGPGPGPEPGPRPAPRGARRQLLLTGGARTEEPVVAAGGWAPRPPDEPRSSRGRPGGGPPPEGLAAAAPPVEKPRAAPSGSTAAPLRESPASSPASVRSDSPPAAAAAAAAAAGGGADEGGLGAPASSPAGGVIKVSQGMRALLGLG